MDPLDGTTNFLFGLPMWAVSIACEDAEGPLVACVFEPKRSELFSAARGSGTQLNGLEVRVSTRDDISHALVATGLSYDGALRSAQAEQLATLIARVRDVRRCGAASLELASVACGRLEGFYEAGLGRWDWAAGALLVSEAGGTFTRAASPHGLEQVVASNGELQPEPERLVTASR